MLNRLLTFLIIFLSTSTCWANVGVVDLEQLFGPAMSEGDQSELYLIFGMSEKSCLVCTSELNSIWCQVNRLGQYRTSLKSVILFGGNRRPVYNQVVSQLEPSNCTIPVKFDSGSVAINELFDGAQQAGMLICDRSGNVLLEREIGQMDDFSSFYDLDRGVTRLVAYIDSLLLHQVSPASNRAVSLTGLTHEEEPRVEQLEPIVLVADSTLGFAYSPHYDPDRRSYLIGSGSDKAVYEFSEDGRATSRLVFTIPPAMFEWLNGKFYTIGGVLDTVIQEITGDDTLAMPDMIVKMQVRDHNMTKLSEMHLPAASNMSLSNQMGINPKTILLGTQRSATATFLRKSGLKYPEYLEALYDSSNYSRYVDTTKVIYEYGHEGVLRHAYGTLPPSMKVYGFKRTHYWLEFARWFRPAANGDVYYLHAADPVLYFYRGGKEIAAVNLDSDGYSAITGNESQKEISYFNSLFVGEDGNVYVQFFNVPEQKSYLWIVSSEAKLLAGSVPLPNNDICFRADSTSILYSLNRENMTIGRFRPSL